MSKTKNRPPIVLPDDALSVSVHFYYSDGVPRVAFTFAAQNVSFDHPVSDYSSLSAGQKSTLLTLLTALRDETYTLEGYA